jgi:hypothetical protein
VTQDADNPYCSEAAARPLACVPALLAVAVLITL